MVNLHIEYPWAAVFGFVFSVVFVVVLHYFAPGHPLGQRLPMNETGLPW